MIIKVGLGYDIHSLQSGTELILGGVKIPSKLRSIGHSDGDALLHALADAILGAIGAGDIGQHFPSDSAELKGMNSAEIVRSAHKRLTELKFDISNVDCNVLLEKPKLAPYREAITKNVAELLHISSDLVSVKFKTSDGIGAVGRMEAIEAQVVLLIVKK